jgi:hypothetical protein
MNHKAVDEVLRYDPLDTAERIHGRGSDESVDLGLALALVHNKTKRDMLVTLCDTTYGDSVKRFVAIAQDLGFEAVLQVPFEGRAYEDQTPPAETFHVMAHRDGMLLVFDTYFTNSVNSAKVYYNWLKLSDTDTYHVISSGSWHRYDDATGLGVWAGDHDAREALRHKVSGLRNTGKFLACWERQPFLWLLHYMDTKQPGYDYKSINQQRIASLPMWVQTMITPKENT